MTKPETPLTPDQATDAELSAYLDGEVDQAARDEIEQKLSSHEVYRERLQVLQASWDLLDQLPGSDTDESFTRSTVAMAALHIEQPPTSESLVSRQLARWPWLRLGGCIAASFLVGFVAIAVPTRIAHRYAVKDLELIQNFEIYYYADSEQFLKLLDEEGLFAEELDELL